MKDEQIARLEATVAFYKDAFYREFSLNCGLTEAVGTATINGINTGLEEPQG